MIADDSFNELKYISRSETVIDSTCFEIKKLTTKTKCQFFA